MLCGFVLSCLSVCLCTCAIVLIGDIVGTMQCGGDDSLMVEVRRFCIDVFEDMVLSFSCCWCCEGFCCLVWDCSCV